MLECHSATANEYCPSSSTVARQWINQNSLADRVDRRTSGVQVKALKQQDNSTIIPDGSAFVFWPWRAPDAISNRYQGPGVVKFQCRKPRLSPG
jgi:hypothetical protein